ncbi:SDR family oxidoreductase [Spirosoma flavus]
MNTPIISADQPTPAILITGATGNIGQELTRLLSERGVRFRAMVRNSQRESELAGMPGVEVVAGDFNDSDSLASALRGIERAFLLTPSSEQAETQQLRFVEQAQKAGVRHVVKLSQLAADEHSPVRFLRYHAVVEQAIRNSGLDFTFLRPNLFMQGLLNFRSSIAESGQFFAPIGNAGISVIDVRDIANVAAAALTENGHSEQTYTLTGPESLRHSDMAEELSNVLGRPVTFVDITPELMRATLDKIGFPAWQADGLIEDYAHYSRNEAAMVASGVWDATGLIPRSFAQFAKDYAPAFQVINPA